MPDDNLVQQENYADCFFFFLQTLFFYNEEEPVTILTLFSKV